MSGSGIGEVTFGIVEQTARDFNNTKLTLNERLDRYYKRENSFLNTIKSPQKQKVQKKQGDDGRGF